MIMTKWSRSKSALSFAVFCFCALNLLPFFPFFGVTDHVDVLTESAYLCVLVYVRLVLSSSLQSKRLIPLGLNVLMLAALYDVLTEIEFLVRWSQYHAVLDNIIEQGGMLVAVSCIAIGIDRLIKAKDHEIHRDALTGLYNRRYLDRFSQEQLALVYIDLNDLKIVNDTQGHEAGDELIIQFSQLLTKSTEDDEYAFRVGGDEFILLLKPNRISLVLGALKSMCLKRAIKFSYGFSEFTEGSLSTRVKLADERMYQMKKCKIRNNFR
ncbi:TPA: diguanylate cyclase [Vibrio vulnificus]|uniref:GGDEF domain-containing protein n=1 Tax=Vibrio sp. 05-20-BW147 TaxID=2575834 RepID=UPI0015946845|nr:GGDEF domain-containing protein [Vibrio sp. 05-20-BW147]NVC63670.1 GGDEF domain-containing protein [Vibrio sp. 05-20-BW147]HAS6349894.1 diguanylate cyclase [Vibrio vulnificus]